MPEASGSHPAPQFRPPTRRAFSVVANLVAAFLGFSVICALLGIVLPFPDVAVVGPKVKYFGSRPQNYNLLFIGSSRFNHQIIPLQFDSALAQAGVQVRSFNLGVDAMWPPESFFVLREVLSHPVNLKWVVIELLYFGPVIRENARSERMVYWHDAHSTALVLRDLLATKKPWRQFGLGMEHVWLWIQRSSNYGRGMEWVNAELTARAGKTWLPNWSKTEGYMPGADNGLSGAELEKFKKDIDELRRKRVVYPVPATFLAEVGEIVTLVRKTGAEPVFVLSPTTNIYEKRESVPGGAPILDLGDPFRYPELFRPEHYYDKVHLNPEGAQLFTGYLADEFLAHVSGTRPAQSQPVSPP